MRLAFHFILTLQVIVIGNYADSKGAVILGWLLPMYIFQLLGLLIGGLIPMSLVEPFYIHIPASIVY